VLADSAEKKKIIADRQFTTKITWRNMNTQFGWLPRPMSTGTRGWKQCLPMEWAGCLGCQQRQVNRCVSDKLSLENWVDNDGSSGGSIHEGGNTEESNRVGNPSITFSRTSNYNLASAAFISVLLCCHQKVNGWLQSFWVFCSTKRRQWLIKNLFHLHILANSFYFNQSIAI
jgi:hypothetical protein